MSRQFAGHAGRAGVAAHPRRQPIQLLRHRDRSKADHPDRAGQDGEEFSHGYLRMASKAFLMLFRSDSRVAFRKSSSAMLMARSWWRFSEVSMAA